MSLANLTQRERRVFDAVRMELIARRPAPTYRDLAAITGSPGGSYQVVTQLVRKGYLTRQRGHNRTLALTPSADAYTVHLDPYLNRRLAEHVAAWSATPEHVIVQALTDYLGRQA